MKIKFQGKKDKGSYIDQFFPILLGAIAMALFIVIFSNFMANIDKKNNVDQVARKYILMMEADGYLDSTDEAALMTELADCGVSSIDLTGTTRSEVGYGQTVTLVIKGKLAIKNLGIGEGLTFLEGPGTIDIYITKVSTAKH